MWRLIILNIVLDSIYNCFNFAGIALISVLFMSVGSILIVPIGIVTDMLIHDKIPGTLSLTGCVLIVVGFVVNSCGHRVSFLHRR